MSDDGEGYKFVIKQQFKPKIDPDFQISESTGKKLAKIDLIE